jgi:Ca-activated chloride channel family protein
MRTPEHLDPRWLVGATLAVAGLALAPSAQTLAQEAGGFRFRTRVDLVNVTATVTDSSGRFVSGLSRDDFLVYEDDQLQRVTHFSNERVPVSLGIVLDTSGSMAGEKLIAARAALDRFLDELLAPEDDIFLYRFSNDPILVQGWTRDRRQLRRALGHLTASGGTALYDTVAEAVPLAETGRHHKKALLIISDGNDTSSRTSLSAVKQLIRESEVLVYAIGIDGRATPTLTTIPPRIPTPIPLPWPGRRGPRPWPGGGVLRIGDDRVNVAALRSLTDDSGGRAEIVRAAHDLDPATASIADELSKQYSLGYPARGWRDGRWHTIRVDVRDRSYRVRARRGYVATP